MMRRVSPQPRRTSAVAIGVVLAASAVFAPGGAYADASRADARSASTTTGQEWIWPVVHFRVEAPFAAPAHPYGPGHRGIDLRPTGAPDLRAPAAGTVAFVGQVAGRGIVTIDHGDGLVTTLEPVDSTLTAGSALAQGAPVGTIAAGGHAAGGTVHFGVRLHGEYINPMLLVGGVPRAVLLPCC